MSKIQAKRSFFLILLVLLISCVPVAEYTELKSETPKNELNLEKVCNEIVPDEVYDGSTASAKIAWENGWTTDTYAGFGENYLRPYPWFRQGQYSGENVNLWYSNQDFPAVKKIVNIDEQGNIRDVAWYWYDVRLVIAPEASRFETDRFGTKYPYHEVVKATCTLHKVRKE